MSELRGILSTKQCDLLYRELQNFAPHVCSPRSTTELIIYHFMLTKTVYFRKCSERFTLEYVRRGHSGHCIRAFPRTRQAWYYALKNLEKRGVITVTRTGDPNWFAARLELPGLLDCVLSSRVAYENVSNREELLHALDRLRRYWKRRAWRLKAITLRPEIAKLQIDIFDEPQTPRDQTLEDRKLDWIRRKVHKLCLKRGITFAWNVPTKAMAKNILHGYDSHLEYCKKHRLDAEEELERLVSRWAGFVGSKPKNEDGVRFSVSPKLRLSDFFIYQRSLRRYIEQDREADHWEVEVIEE